LQTPGAARSQAAAGYADYPEFNDYSFIGAFNAAGGNSTRGLEVDYRQQLVFLPGFLKGLSVYGSISRVIASRERFGVVNRSGSAGLSYRYAKFGARLNGTWQAPYLTRKLTNTSGNGYNDGRTALDAEASYIVFRNLALFINGRNITDAAFTTYIVPTATGQKLLDSTARYGAFWTVGVKGRF
jgi:hypothetical protein